MKPLCSLYETSLCSLYAPLQVGSSNAINVLLRPVPLEYRLLVQEAKTALEVLMQLLALASGLCFLCRFSLWLYLRTLHQHAYRAMVSAKAHLLETKTTRGGKGNRPKIARCHTADLLAGIRMGGRLHARGHNFRQLTGSLVIDQTDDCEGSSTHSSERCEYLPVMDSLHTSTRCDDYSSSCNDSSRREDSIPDATQRRTHSSRSDDLSNLDRVML